MNLKNFILHGEKRSRLTSGTINALYVQLIKPSLYCIELIWSVRTTDSANNRTKSGSPPTMSTAWWRGTRRGPRWPRSRWRRSWPSSSIPCPARPTGWERCRGSRRWWTACRWSPVGQLWLVLGSRSTEVTFALPTHQPWVRLQAFPKFSLRIFSWCC